MSEKLISDAPLQKRVLTIRGSKVILDSDLADLYGVQTKRLNEQVKRNSSRFPDDFMFRLNEKEKKEVVANCDHLQTLKFSPNLPYAFTEHGVLMLASVLNSNIAIQVSLKIVKTFILMREALLLNAPLEKQLQKLEKKFQDHDQKIDLIFKAIREMNPLPERKKRLIGFNPTKGKK